MARYDLVIFDLDGTLIDSQQDIGDAVAWTMARYGLPPITPETLRQHIGTGVKPLVRARFEAARDERIHEALAAFDEFYASCSTVKTRPYPGVAEVLDHLGATTKVILTNKSSKFVDGILAGLGLTRHFAAAFGREAFAEIKPSRVPVDGILERFRAPRDRCLIIGDTPLDILAGKAAGIATCGVLYGYGARDQVMGAKPDVVVSQAIDLLGIL